MVKTLARVITFKVDAVVPAGKPLAEWKTYRAVERLLGTEVEACHDYHGTVVRDVGFHGLLAAVEMAFSQHRPLVLSPDMIWITVAQGLAQHMALHGEELRKNIVQHEGRVALGVDLSHFVKGSPENPWEEAFAAWSGQIREHVGAELHEQLVCNFSTTGVVERAVSEIVLMDVFERFFRYVAVGICGIPEITLEGTVQDWEKLRRKVEVLKRFEMGWWLEHLRGICDEFVCAARGEIHLGHWQAICKLQSEYGGNIINGWIAKLFPYLRAAGQGPARILNPIFETGEGFSTLNAPMGLSKVPFSWLAAHAGGKARMHAMEAVGGFTGVEQDKETKALRPRIGWAVREASKMDTVTGRVLSEHKGLAGLKRDRDEGNELTWRYKRVPFDAAQFLHATNGALLFAEGRGARFGILPWERWAHVFGVDACISDEQSEKEFVQFHKKYGGTAWWERFCDLADGSYVVIDLKKRLLNSETAEEARVRRTLHEKWDPIEEAEKKRLKEEAECWRASQSGGDDGDAAEHFRKLMAESEVMSECQEAFESLRNPYRWVNFVMVCRPETVGVEGACPIIAESFTEFLERALDSGGRYWWLETGFESYGDGVARIREREGS